ncbi:MAG: AAA family ATPase, partial [Methanocorpusculum sp.]|nr:AAA family ATPase [Methanocorpusculum sp.]
MNNLPSGRIILCRDVRLSAGANFDSVVTIEKIPAIYADKITVQPIEDIGGFSDSIKQKIEDALIGRLVSKDSAYSIYQEIDSPFSSSFFEFGFARPTSFVVTDVSPSDYAIVTSATIIEFKDKAYSKSQKIIKEDEESDRPEVHYEDIGGLGRELSQVREMIEYPLRHPEVFEKLGIEPPKGVLLYGPPGTGKTLIAKAVATESQAKFYEISGPEIVSKYYGDSEEK